jgi:hypothetical protein
MHRNRPNKRSMTMESTPRSISSLVATVLLVVFATDGSFAKGATLRGHHVNRVGQSAKQNASRPISAHPDFPNNHPVGDFSAAPNEHESNTQDAKVRATPDNAGKNEPGGTPRGKIGKVGVPKESDVKVPSKNAPIGSDHNSVETKARDVNAIETRITAPSHGQKSKSDNVHGPKMPIKSLATQKLPTHRQAVTGVIHGVARNAVGMPIERHGDTPSEAGKAYGGKPALPVSAATPAGTDRGAPNIVPSDGVVRPSNVAQPNPLPTINPAASNRGMINGTGLARIGSGSSVIGGPAKMVAGLNGTAIRLKH